MDALPILLLPLGIVLVAVVAYLGYRAEQKRRALLQAFALSNGWTYVDRDDSWCDRFPGDPFGEGDNRKAGNVLQGRHGKHDMVAFEYRYKTHTTNSKGHRSTTTYRFAVCAVSPACAAARAPADARVGASAGSAGRLGFGDVELESEDFNRRYRVAARDPKFAYDVLHPRTMEALLSRPAAEHAARWPRCRVLGRGQARAGGAARAARHPRAPHRGHPVVRLVRPQPVPPAIRRAPARGSTSMTALYVALVLVALLLLAVIVSYNRFVRQRNLVQESWRQVDVELRRRYDLIPTSSRP